VASGLRASNVEAGARYRRETATPVDRDRLLSAVEEHFAESTRAANKAYRASQCRAGTDDVLLE
jgi:hypothetical protein